MPEFAHPLVLWLLPVLTALLVWRWISRPAAVAVSSTAHFTGGEATTRWFTTRHFLLTIESLAAAAFIIALARPQSDIELIPMTKEGTDIMIVLDYSNSMDAYDGDPDMTMAEVIEVVRSGELKDRLGVAADQIAQFVERRKDDRIGLVIFGVNAYISCPPTLDHDFLIGLVRMLDNSLLDVAERGTNIGGGLAAAINSLVEHSDNKRTIILITDGDNTARDEVYTPQEAAEVAREKGITVHTIGIGGDRPYLPLHLQQLNATIRFDTRTLEEIAGITGGRFFRPKDNEGFEEVMGIIDSLETSSRAHPALIYQRDLFPFVLITGFVLLAFALILRYTFLQTLV